MSAQLEDGYTRIADQILEEISKQKLNGTQFRILMVVWRYTYGFNRKDHEMSLSFFEKATELGKTQLDREIKNLIESKVLVVTKESTYTASRKLQFNKNIAEWTVNTQQKRGQSAKTLTHSQYADEQSAKLRTQTVSQNADQDIHSFKENFKDNTTTPDDFEVIRVRFRELHGVRDLPYNDGPILTKLLADGIPRETIIGVMENRFKPSASTIKYYEAAIREAHQEVTNPKPFGGEKIAQFRRFDGRSTETYNPDEDELNDLYIRGTKPSA